MNTQPLTRGLVFFSIGLGLAELLAPRPLTRTIGVDEDNETLLRLLGLREIGAGVGLMQGSSAIFMWSRVAGDALDLGLLGAALRSRKSDRTRVLSAIAAVAGVTVLDVVAAILLSRNPAKSEWRVDRADRRGMDIGAPETMRQHADRLMAEHQSGHLRAERDETRQREEAATHQFAPGD